MIVLKMTAAHALLLLASLTFFSLTTIPQANAFKAKWKGNKNVKPEHRAAHEAPRSQKYWDEHGIDRPDYAKTDAELAEERRKNGGEEGLIKWWMKWIGGIFLVPTLALIAGLGYGKATGDWQTVNLYMDRLESLIPGGGMGKGQKLGSSDSGKTATTTKVSTISPVWGWGNKSGNGMSDDEAKRLARIARFDNVKLE